MRDFPALSLSLIFNCVEKRGLLRACPPSGEQADMYKTTVKKLNYRNMIFEISRHCSEKAQLLRHNFLIQ
jgi:hypothetical protein